MAFSVCRLRAPNPFLLEENITKVFPPLIFFLLARGVPHPTCHVNTLYPGYGGEMSFFLFKQIQYPEIKGNNREDKMMQEKQSSNTEPDGSVPSPPPPPPALLD